MAKCKYCNKIIFGKSAGAHVTNCDKNPKRKEIRQKISCAMKKNNPMFNEKHRKTLSNIINEKVKNGTWHNSFSKSRTHKYKNNKFYGKWELEYAKWLDKNNIKWLKNKKIFNYIFEGKKRLYTPDFYLIDEDCYIEIKGYETDKDRAKWEQFPETLKILKGKELKKLGIIDNYRNFSK